MRARLHIVVSCLVLVFAARLQGQAFHAGANYIGPSLSLATYGSAAAVEGNFEHAINDKWGWGLSVGYYSYGDAAYHYTVIPVAGTAAYHFPVSNEKLDPFVGGSIGYFIFSCSFDDGVVHGDCGNGARNSGLLIGGYGGIRYWLNDKVALAGRAGFGIGFLTVGVDFKM